MNYQNQLSCYCFNRACQLSIFNKTNCIPVNVPLEVALSRPLHCVECGAELLSPVLIEIKRDILELLEKENYCTVAIVDDDVVFHQTVKSLLKKHNVLQADFFENGHAFIDDLAEKVVNKVVPPNILFLDLHMPGMNGWELLKSLQAIQDQSEKSMSVYIISNSVDPSDHERAKKHPSVKAFISKPLTRHFLEKINDELLKILKY